MVELAGSIVNDLLLVLAKLILAPTVADFGQPVQRRQAVIVFNVDDLLNEAELLGLLDDHGTEVLVTVPGSDVQGESTASIRHGQQVVTDLVRGQGLLIAAKTILMSLPHPEIAMLPFNLLLWLCSGDGFRLHLVHIKERTVETCGEV